MTAVDAIKILAITSLVSMVDKFPLLRDLLNSSKSDNPARVQGVLKNLRDSGVVAIGVGITSEGAPVLSTYAPNALVVEDVKKLPIILGELLKEHLKDL